MWGRVTEAADVAVVLGFPVFLTVSDSLLRVPVCLRVERDRSSQHGLRIKAAFLPERVRDLGSDCLRRWLAIAARPWRRRAARALAPKPAAAHLADGSP